MTYTVLLVDDVLLNRKVVKVALSGLPDFSFLEAADGVNALEMINNHPVDLVILDLVMPGTISGFEVLGQIKASVLFKHIPVIVYSAVADTASIKQALEMGAYDYLIKPLKPKELQTILPEKVRDALQTIELEESANSQTIGMTDMLPEPSVKMREQVTIGRVTNEEAASIKYLANRKAEIKLLLKRLVDMDKEELYCCLYDILIREMGEVSTACEQWWDEKYDKYQWANIVGDEIEIDYNSGDVLVKKESRIAKEQRQSE
ncbi:CXXX repeat peptide modification system protein [Sporomusa sp.]|uniref:CXXX repeat peptide modification system protein n=1 Tax=Sporomusa sp. TaxID=2078658 RepID=UPI002CB06A34|nr:CXXX repeat peptide modification system protein [Sporomusa sp.]HWR42724.1 CXXX repeat peptide modification system protein [Sporomusa sp.]